MVDGEQNIVPEHRSISLHQFTVFIMSCVCLAVSDAYTSRDLIYEWETVSLARGIYLSQFDLLSYPFRNATVQRKGASLSDRRAGRARWNGSDGRRMGCG